MLAYDRLTLRIEQAAEPGRYEVVAQGGAGEGHGEFAVPFEDRDVENFVLRMSRGRRRTRRIETSDATQAKDFGRRLFDAVFQGEVRDVYRSSLADARRGDRGLRLTLALTKAPALMDLPWEYLYDEPDFLAASVWTPVVRYLDVAKPATPLAVPPPLRILGMISRAEDLAELDVDEERRRLELALKQLTRTGRVEVHWTQEATLESLLRKLRAGDFHVFHYVGHGAYDELREDGLLLLEGEDGRSVEVTGERLARILNDHHPMRLAVLNACEGARASDTDPFAGVAASLVQRGLPAVVAMQFEITDAAAVKFAEHFYGALARGFPVDAATAQARQGIYATGNDVEWGTPVLFLRPQDGRIFDLSWEDARSEGPELSATLEAHPTEVAVGDLVTWTLYVQNTGRPSLFRAGPAGLDGRRLCEPTDLVSGENVVFTWESTVGDRPELAVDVVAETGAGREVRTRAEARLDVHGLEPKPDDDDGDDGEDDGDGEGGGHEPGRLAAWVAHNRLAVGAAAALLAALVVVIVFLTDVEQRPEAIAGDAPIAVPGAPNALAAAGDLLWVSTRAGTVGVTSRGELLEAPREATRGGRTIAANREMLWVPIPTADTVTGLDAGTGEPRASLTASSPKAVALTADHVYVSQRQAGRAWVQRFDADTAAESGRPIDVPAETERISVRDGVLWVLVRDPGDGPDHIARYDAETGAERPSVAVGAGASAMAYGDGAYWVTNSDDGTVTRVDAESLETSAFETGGEPANVRVGLGAVWVTNPPLGRLQALDPDSGDVRDVTVGRHPYSLAIAGDGLWVGDTRENDVRFVSVD